MQRAQKQHRDSLSTDIQVKTTVEISFVVLEGYKTKTTSKRRNVLPDGDLMLNQSAPSS